MAGLTYRTAAATGFIGSAVVVFALRVIVRIWRSNR